MAKRHGLNRVTFPPEPSGQRSSKAAGDPAGAGLWIGFLLLTGFVTPLASIVAIVGYLRKYEEMSAYASNGLQTLATDRC